MVSKSLYNKIGFCIYQAVAEQNFTINVKLIDVLQQFVRQAKNGVLLVYENAQREDVDASVICPKNAPPYILENNVRALGGVPMKGTWS